MSEGLGRGRRLVLKRLPNVELATKPQAFMRSATQSPLSHLIG